MPRCSTRPADHLRPVRHWFLPPQHRMIAFFTSQPPAAVMSCRLTTPALAYLQEHRVNKRAILPGAAMFELAYAAAAVLAAGDELGCKDRMVLTNLGIAAPLLLPPTIMTNSITKGTYESSYDRSPALVCTMQHGTVRLSSGNGTVVHLQASAACFADERSLPARSSSGEQQRRALVTATGISFRIVQQPDTADCFDSALGSIDIQVRCVSMMLESPGVH